MNFEKLNELTIYLFDFYKVLICIFLIFIIWESLYRFSFWQVVTLTIILPQSYYFSGVRPRSPIHPVTARFSRGQVKTSSSRETISINNDIENNKQSENSSIRIANDFIINIKEKFCHSWTYTIRMKLTVNRIERHFYSIENWLF